MPAISRNFRNLASLHLTTYRESPDGSSTYRIPKGCPLNPNVSEGDLMRLADLAFPNLLQLDLEETTFTRLQLSEANCPKLQTLRVNRRYSHQADYTTGALWLRLALQLPSLTLLGLCGFLTRAEDLASSLGAPSCPRLAKIVMRDVSIRPMGAEDMAVPGWHEHPPLMLDLPSCVSLSLTMVDLPVLRVFAPSLARLHFNECMPSACTLPYFSLLKSIHRSAASAPSNILDMHPPALTHALVRSDSSSSSGSSGSSSSGSGGTSTSSSAGAGRADGAISRTFRNLSTLHLTTYSERPHSSYPYRVPKDCPLHPNITDGDLMRLSQLRFPNLVQLDLEGTSFTRLGLSGANCPKLQTLRVDGKELGKGHTRTLSLALRLPSLTTLGLCGFITKGDELAASLGAASCPGLAKIVLREVSIRPKGAEDMRVPGWHETPPLVLDLPSCTSLFLTMVDLPVLRVFAPSLARIHFMENMVSACTLPHFSLLTTIQRQAVSQPSLGASLATLEDGSTHGRDSSSNNGSSGSACIGLGGASTSDSSDGEYDPYYDCVYGGGSDQ
ncbi:MAG: hypothetical protein WDW38_010277 [Sanguina aurantia]